MSAIRKMNDIRNLNINRQSALLLATLLTAPLSFAADDPFGFDVTVSPTEYDYCSPNPTDEWGKGFYVCTSAPKPHSEFAGYNLWFIDGIGLCRLVAGGRLIENDSYGSETRERMETIKEQLKKKYSESIRGFDHLKAGSIWDEPRDWMKGIHVKEREYSYFWLPPEHKRVGNVEGIKLNASAINSSTGWIELRFDYLNVDACLKREQDKQSDAF